MDTESKPASAFAPARRRPGRPPRDGQATAGREALLDATLALFARQGIAETPFSAVASAVGVSKAMLHYHFKTRDQLLDVIVEERLLPLRRRVAADLQGMDDPLEALLLMARRLIGQALQHAWLAPLWIREVLSEGGLLRARMHDRVETSERDSLPVARWHAQGLLNPGLQPELVVLSLHGLVLLPLAVAPQPGSPFQRRPDEATLVRHVAALLGHGIAADTRPAG